MEADLDKLDTLTIRGFKSFKELERFQFKNLNVFIGANGAGKTNFISFFKMLHSLMDDNLGGYVRDNGGMSNIFHNGLKGTPKMEFEMHFGERGYRFAIYHKPPDKAALSNEACFYKQRRTGWFEFESSYDEYSELVKEAKGGYEYTFCSKPVYDTIMSWQIYHFHDTSSTAPMRYSEIIQDNKVLRSNGSNIAPLLLHLRNNYHAEYNEILRVCRLILPFLKDFLLDEEISGSANEIKKVRLSWRTKNSDFPMQPYHLSDGSIRFICLATALLQPFPPSTLIIDEPELGLHPEAMHILSELITKAAERTQVIVATQSPLLVDQFNIEDIVIVNRKGDQSVFERLCKEDFEVWLEDYSTGELWRKNVIQGGICYE